MKNKNGKVNVLTVILFVLFWWVIIGIIIVKSMINIGTGGKNDKHRNH